MKWRKFVMPLVIVGLPIIGVSSCIIRDDRLDRDFKAITTGMSSQEIERIMGSPSWNSDCGDGRLPEIHKRARVFNDFGVDGVCADVVGGMAWD